MRSCGECLACCMVPGIPEIGKPVHTVCSNHSCGKCSIYSSRPECCKEFVCCWLTGAGSEEDRPDKSGIMLSVTPLEGRYWLVGVELYEGALLNGGQHVALETIRQVRLPMIIVDYGSSPPDDYGNRVLLRDDLKHTARAMIGDEIQRMSEDAALYSLVVTRWHQ